MSVDERRDSAPTTADLRRPEEHAVAQPGAPQGAGAVVVAFRDQIQVDVGGYQIHSGDVTGPIIAELYVEIDPVNPRNTRLLIEHWGLYPDKGWITPSATNERPPPLAFVRVGGWTNATAFRAYLELKGKANVTYVQARCETMDP